MSKPPLTRRQVLSLAWPLVLSQTATALPGLVDTAVMGRTGTATDLAAVAVAAVLFQFLYWAFGFLRMATTGLTAQARGRDDPEEVQAQLLRGTSLAVALGLVLLVVTPLLQDVALLGFDASAGVRKEAGRYGDARILAAPFALVGFVINGWLLGVGRTRALLAYQLVLNLSNAVLDVVFVGALGWGAAGIGGGTALAEALAAGFGLWLVRRDLSWRVGLWSSETARQLFSSKRDILVRTLALLASFAWFVNAGTRQGDAEAAGNQVLLQFIAVSAFVLDAFAFLAEKETGEAVGARSPARLRQAIARTTELSLVSGALFALGFWSLGPLAIDAMVADPDARAVALAHLPACSLVPLLGVFAWQLDGVFLGATRGRTLRNAAVLSTGLYIGLDILLRGHGNPGVWTAFVSLYALRALALAPGLPGLFASLRSPSQAGPLAP